RSPSLMPWLRALEGKSLAPSAGCDPFSTSGPLPALRSFPTRRSSDLRRERCLDHGAHRLVHFDRSRRFPLWLLGVDRRLGAAELDRKSTRLNSSHVKISYAVFCLTKKMAWA